MGGNVKSSIKLLLMAIAISLKKADNGISRHRKHRLLSEFSHSSREC